MASKVRSDDGLKRGFLKEDHAHRLAMECARLFWESIDTPVSLGLSLRAKYGLWQEIAEYKIDPLNYRSETKFRLDYAAVNFLRKYPNLPISVDRKENGIRRFLDSEEKCALTNTLLRGYRRGQFFPLNSQVSRVLLRARSKIAYVLGSLDLNEVFQEMRWGPGSTSAVSASSVSAYNKFDAAPEVTLGCLPYAMAAINCTPAWARTVIGTDNPCSVLASAFRVVPGNRITTVPKDALIDRVIAIEPHMNIYVQLGFGKVIRRRLLRVGVDLDYGQSRNGELARQGACDGSLATIDLSSASDTISRSLVEELLPSEWFNHLDLVRSQRLITSRKGVDQYQTRLYNKFSSMGNGFTFELESLIFWALSKACLDELNVDSDRLCIYGDDLIIPVSAYPLLLDVLCFSGFEVNKKKSYATGLFRESCGEHFFGGLNVKPVYLDKCPRTVLELFAFANQLTYLALRWGIGKGCADKRLLAPRMLLINGVSKRDRLFGPLFHGDGVLIGTFDECSRTMKKIPFGREGYSYLSFHPVPKKRVASGRATLAWALYEIRKEKEISPPIFRKSPKVVYTDFAITNRPSQGRYVLRGMPHHFKTKKLEVQRPIYVGYWQ